MAVMQMLITQIDEAELAVRLCEANYCLARPAHLDAKQALQAMDEDVREGWKRSARAALAYICERIENGSSITGVQ